VIIRSRFPGRCSACGTEYPAGAEVDWVRGEMGARCSECVASGRRPEPPPDEHELRIEAIARGLPERTRRVRELVEAGRAQELVPEGIQLAIDIQLCFRAGFELVRAAGDEPDQG